MPCEVQSPGIESTTIAGREYHRNGDFDHKRSRGTYILILIYGIVEGDHALTCFYRAKPAPKFNPTVWTPRGIAVITLTATEGWRFASSIRRRFDRSQHNVLRKSAIGGVCDINADCEHKGSICLRNRCRCHPHYIEANDEKGRNTRCVPLPAKVGASCTNKCREPLFCRNGECQCVQRGTTRISNGECVTSKSAAKH
ncbi:hypothetical protein ANCCEY_07736 [Ancylostoma ceylanicum]|uniref:EB domain-containing protein n=1 Tax=Ancylostoma ceylanicum TaxID=53326 RepID=A0A0D6LM58_9BILA|nr:hypothetical protein ANCCEY_07736 [Ancylostoma ceylanicum]